MTDTVNLFFNGKELSFLKNGRALKSWPAMSGREGYQHRYDVFIKNKGPIPEGIWHVRQKNHQNIKGLSSWGRTKSKFGFGTWPGLESSWGEDRIWLEPHLSTRTFGRTGITIHGGDEFGSAGCIDLAGGMPDFIKFFKEYNDDLDLIVRYPEDF